MVLAAQEIEMETMSQFANEKDLLKAKVKRLEDILFARGAMEEAPCFCCGYNGPGYYQPDQHPCAKRHHKLTANDELSCAAAALLVKSVRVGVSLGDLLYFP